MPETSAIKVISFHAAIEHEIEIALGKIIPRTEALFNGTPKLGALSSKGRHSSYNCR
ncbi:hypothetical protein [Sphingobium sp. Ndbn-10]|nr:hypothetical protein [Sphingobium sp. Ndbn-10]